MTSKLISRACLCTDTESTADFEFDFWQFLCIIDQPKWYVYSTLFILHLKVFNAVVKILNNIE